MKNIILFLTMVITLSLQSSTPQHAQHTAESSEVYLENGTPCDQMNNRIIEKNIKLGMYDRVRAQLINAQTSVSDTCVEIKEACKDGLAQAADFAKSASQLAIEIIGFPVAAIYCLATRTAM